MGTWRVSADLLAQARFRVSVRAESAAALRALVVARDPSEQAFRAAHGAAFAAMLDAHPVRKAVLEHSFRRQRGNRPGWIAHYLCLPPRSDHDTMDDELAHLAATPDDALRADLEETAARRLPPRLRRAPLAAAATDLLRWVWTHTLESDWTRRERILRADVVARTSRLATHGWAAVLRDLGRDREWVGDGHLRINRYDLPSHTLEPDAQLIFVPVSSTSGWVGWDPPERYAIFYAMRGRLAATTAPRTGGLARLVGANRATILELLDEPGGTSHLAARTGLPLGSVGNHLRVLLDAGAVERRRSGRDVLYWRTALGDAMVAAGSPPAARRSY